MNYKMLGFTGFFNFNVSQFSSVPGLSIFYFFNLESVILLNV